MMVKKYITNENLSGNDYEQDRIRREKTYLRLIQGAVQASRKRPTDTSKKHATIHPTVQKRLDVLMDLFKIHPELTAADVQSKIRTTDNRKNTYDLNRLVTLGLLKFDGTHRTRIYSVVGEDAK